MRIQVLTVVLGGVVAATAMAPAPAAAHGAPDSPVSRTFACAPDGPHVQSDACQAALAASDRQSFDDWDYVRVAGVDGRDREVIPDGALCSGGVPGFAGLDLARADWPSTEVRAGAEFTVTYRTTIPHLGGFRLYVTRDGYDPAEPLAWSDLEEEPFLTVTDPELVGDAYQLPGRWPAGKAGHHVLFTIWQNFDTPDTYYACSDVVFDPPATSPPSSSPPATTSAPTPTAEPVRLARSARPEADTPAMPIALAAGTAVVVVAVAALIWHQRRPRRIR